MNGTVFHLHSTIELPLEDVYAFFDDPDLPSEIEDIEITRRNNTLIISAVAPEGTVGKYTPTAQIKGTVTETRVPDEDAEIPEPPPTDGQTWGDPGEVEQPTKLIEVAAFKGDREAILQNTALQYPMFTVLCNLSRQAERGTLTAITVEDGELTATRIVDGEDRPASIKIVEDRQGEGNTARGVNWRDNKYISD